MKTARQVVGQAVAEWMERGDVETLARQVREAEDGIMPPNQREKLADELGIWRFGKWALLGDEAGQAIKRQLEYQARVKESPTFWQSIVPLNDDEGVAYDSLICRVLTVAQRRAIQCTYQYHMGEETGARGMAVSRYSFRVLRDTALKKLNDFIESA